MKITVTCLKKQHGNKVIILLNERVNGLSLLKCQFVANFWALFAAKKFSPRSGVGNLFGWESHEHHIFLNVIPWEPYNMLKTILLTKDTPCLFFF